eukprot:5148235-Prymnesium_polylepis.1
MHTWLQLFPTQDTFKRLKLQRYRTASGEVFTRPYTGVTVPMRTFFYVCILLPKALITVLVLIGGSGAIVRSGNDFDTLLNTLAATFVLDIDDIVYSLAMPASTKSHCTLPPLNAHPTEGGRQSQYLRLAAQFKFALIVATGAAMAFALHALWC